MARWKLPAMVLDSTAPSGNELLLSLENFRSNYVNGFHPDDGKFDELPITPECTIHSRDDKLRLFL
jgi:hypothetical protein